MLGRKLAGSASFVCLRCRLQRAGAAKRPHFAPVAVAVAVAASSLRIPRRHLSAGTYASNTGADEQSNNKATDAEISADPSPEPRPEPSLEPSLQPSSESTAEPTTTTAGPEEGIPAPYWPPPPIPRRKYASRGHFVAPHQEGLSIDILGKPGSAIVLREKGALKKRHQLGGLEHGQDTTRDQLDPTRFLLDESAAITSEEALLNIHNLKPKDMRVLSPRQFKELKNTLATGFTTLQLENYISIHKDSQRFSQGSKDTDETPPWLVQQQPWAPIVENFVKGSEPQLDGYIKKGMARKERFAVRLMRECWDVSSQDVLDQDGHLSLTLRDVEFSLLTLGNRRWLEGTPRAILAHVKQVKLIRESRLVSIMASKHAAQAIVDRIVRVLSNTRTAEFAATLVSPKPLQSGVLEEVGRTTNTVTRLDPSGKKIVVTWIHMPDRDENFENAGETVFRFLRDACGPHPRVSTALEVVPGDLAQSGRYLPVLQYSQKLPWQERFDKWERWSAGIAQGYDDSMAQALIPADILPFDIGTGEAAKQPEISIHSAPPDWSLELQTDTSAIFGHVVFACQKQAPSSSILPMKPTSKLETALPRTFVPKLPALGSLNLPSNLYEEGLWHTTVVIRFAPSPHTPSELLASAPNLELRIDADHQELKSLTSLRAVQDIFKGDVLFPAAAVDARVSQQRYFTLPGASIEHHVPSLLEFIAKSDLRPWAGKLVTPPFLPGVHLPRRLLSAPPTSSDEAGPVKIDYLFTSTEIHRTITAEYAALKLRYTNILGGQRSGERSELSLDAVRVEPQDADADDNGLLAAKRQPKPDAVPYGVVDEEDASYKAPLVSHNMNQPRDEEIPAVPLRPVELDEFIRAASGIVTEQGQLKWYAKRS